MMCIIIVECNCGGTLLLHGGQKGGERPSAPVVCTGKRMSQIGLRWVVLLSKSR